MTATAAFRIPVYFAVVVLAVVAYFGGAGGGGVWPCLFFYSARLIY